MEPVKPYDPWLHRYYSRYGQRRSRTEPLEILFLIGSADISGGTTVIFEHADFARRHGANVRLAALYPLADAAKSWHPAMDELEIIPIDDAADRAYDLVVATWWPTVFELPRFRFRHAVYFVQSAEARFGADNPANRESALAELTLRMGLPIITITTWLQAYLAFAHNTPAFLASNGIKKELYGPEGPAEAPRPKSGLRVLVEGSTQAPMKGVQEAIECARAGGADEVWLLTPSPETTVPGCDRVFSRIPAAECAAVYRSCDVLVKLSRVEGMFGPPLEMFHCGGTVICYDVTGYDEYVESGYNGLVAPMGDRAAVSDHVASLRADPGLLDELRRNALETASHWPDWATASRHFLHLLQIVAEQPPMDYLPSVLMASGAVPLYERVVTGHE